MMTTDDDDDYRSTPDDPAAIPADSRIREQLLSLPVSTTDADFKRRVFVKIHRRQFAARSALVASLVLLLAAGWVISESNKTPQRPAVAVTGHVPVDSAEPSGDSIDEVELFATAYQGLASPVVRLETLENEPQALLSYLSLLEAAKEGK